jgi:hypothetical protein
MAVWLPVSCGLLLQGLAVVGSFVAATVVSLLQFARLRDKRFLLLAALFACQSQALAREWWDVWRDVYQSAVCAAGLGLVLSLSPRTRRGETSRERRDAGAGQASGAESANA